MSVPAAFVAVVVVWSTTPLAVKWSSSESVSPIEGLGLRMLASALIASALIRLFRVKPDISLAAWRMHSAAALGFFVAMTIVYWSAQYVPSGLIAVMFCVAPLFAGVFGRLLLGERSLTPVRVLSLGAAITGVAMIFRGEIHINQSAAPALLGLVAATMLYALSGVLIKRYRVVMHPLCQTAGALWLSTAGLLLLWLGTDAVPPVEIDLRTGLSIGYLAVFGSLLAFMFYFYLLNNLPVTTVSLIPLMTPPTALVIGWAVAGETVSVSALTGGSVTLFALVVYQWGDAWLRSGRLAAGQAR